MRGLELVLGILLGVGHVLAWPGMRRDVHTSPKMIGPTCTVGAHSGPWPDAGPCPTMVQPAPPAGSQPPTKTHLWPDAFMVDWEFSFVPDNTDAPPYNPLPTSPYNITKGRTFYHALDDEAGLRNMRETYDSFCIPVFGDPSSPMGARNDYSCDFINDATTKTSFVVTHADRPAGVPECCIIGRPFHPPPRNFTVNMPVRWSAPVPVGEQKVIVDWNAVWDKDAGIFNYGFDAVSSEPFAFYMKGVPWIAQWMWQRFHNFTATVPPASTWVLPDSCSTAVACPGW
eukprot:m.10791 g.10791  ORF g.10791 m.10791 type:complete len:285 (-) comp6093_c0_seq1:216-1070(-)